MNRLLRASLGALEGSGRAVALLVILAFATGVATASNLVTGNGFGFAVVRPESGSLSHFYVHPYCFARRDPREPLGEGVATADFVESLGWQGGRDRAPAVAYDRQSQVVRAGSVEGESVYYMPFGLKRTALVFDRESGGGDAAAPGWQVTWRYPLESQEFRRAGGTQYLALRFLGVGESILLIPLSGPEPQSRSRALSLATRRAWILVSIEDAVDEAATVRDVRRWQAGLSPRELREREIRDLERWRVRPAVQFGSDAERQLWRQSEVMLRMAQSREPNRPGRYGSGLIVAALPDGLWFTPWVRDMAFAALALARMGHRDEARAALLAYFNARPVGLMRGEVNGADYQVSVVRYFGDGSEEPFFTQEGSTNIEFDGWGLVLWVLGQYEKQYGDVELLKERSARGRLYESARDFIMRPLLANVEPYGPGAIVGADTSIWEEHQKDRKHFAFTTAMAIVGLAEFADVARQMGDEPARREVLDQLSRLRLGFNAAFIREGRLHGTLEAGEKNDIDGALLPIINLGIITDPDVISDVIDRMALLKVASAGYRRVRSNYTDPTIFEYWYERQEFLFVDISLAELYLRRGATADAQALVGRIVSQANADHNHVPEMYVALPCQLFPGAIGDPTGAVPIVGYGAGAYILYVLQREAIAGTRQPPWP